MNTSAVIIIRHGLNLPPQEGERRVQQYGPEWVAHVSQGGNVRNGNILVPRRATS